MRRNSRNRLSDSPECSAVSDPVSTRVPSFHDTYEMPVKDAMIGLPQTPAHLADRNHVIAPRYETPTDTAGRYGALNDHYYSGGEFSDDDDTFTDGEPEAGVENPGFTSSNGTINTNMREGFNGLTAGSSPTFVTFGENRRSYGDCQSTA